MHQWLTSSFEERGDLGKAAHLAGVDLAVE
jgi:hypothetical protein